MPPHDIDKFLRKARDLVSLARPKPISPLGTKDQDSPLLSRLPPELRWMIWDLYFRGYAVYPYVDGKERLRAFKCAARLTRPASPDSHDDSCYHKSFPCDYVPLLLTCKEMYNYPVVLPTMFNFTSAPGSLVYIPKRLPAHLVALIAHVDISYMLYFPLYLHSVKPSKDAVFWVKLWETLAAMEGLEWLRFALRISVPQQAPEYTEQEWTMWEGVRKGTRPSHFELILPVPAAEESTQEETLLCTVIRRVREPRRPGPAAVVPEGG